MIFVFFFFSSRRRHTRCGRDWSSDVCSSDLGSGASENSHADAPEPGETLDEQECQVQGDHGEDELHENKPGHACSIERCFQEEAFFILRCPKIIKGGDCRNNIIQDVENDCRTEE